MISACVFVVGVGVSGDSLKQEYEPLSERKFIFPGLNQYFRHQSERVIAISLIFTKYPSRMIGKLFEYHGEHFSGNHHKSFITHVIFYILHRNICSPLQFQLQREILTMSSLNLQSQLSITQIPNHFTSEINYYV
jgi:hypothetical protein